MKKIYNQLWYNPTKNGIEIKKEWKKDIHKNRHNLENNSCLLEFCNCSIFFCFYQWKQWKHSFSCISHGPCIITNTRVSSKDPGMEWKGLNSSESDTLHCLNISIHEKLIQLLLTTCVIVWWQSCSFGKWGEQKWVFDQSRLCDWKQKVSNFVSTQFSYWQIMYTYLAYPIIKYSCRNMYW